jgi:Right handed beta helix region
VRAAHHPIPFAFACALLVGLSVSACGGAGAENPDATRAGNRLESPSARAAASGERKPPPSPPCTRTVASVSAAASALSAAAAGSAICLSAGSYGHLELSGAHLGNVTIEPTPGASAGLEGVSVAADASYITIHNFDVSGGVTLAAGDSDITIDHNDIDGEGPGGEGEGVQDVTVDCSAPGAPTYAGCSSTPADDYIAIDGNEIHGYGQGKTEDAIHLNNWEHVTIAANDIYDLEEHGNHTDAMQSVFGGHYMTFAYNYEHDNQSQGFFINDGDASHVTIAENLFLRNDDEPKLYPGGEYNIQVFNTTGLSIIDNTAWDGQEDILRADGAAEPLIANVNHNVEQTLNVLHESGPTYTLRHGYNVFREAPWTIPLGAHSRVIRRPDFVDAATDDYRLRHNPHHIGVDWRPSEFIYGPTGY